VVEVHPGVFTKRFLHQYEVSNPGWIPVQQITLTVTVQTDLVTLTVLQVTVQHNGNKDFTRCSNRGNNNSQDRANNSQNRANNSQDSAENSQGGGNNSKDRTNNSQDEANNSQEGENNSQDRENNSQDGENNSQDRANNSQDGVNNSQDEANNSQDSADNSQGGGNNSQDGENNSHDENNSMQKIEDSKDENNTQDREKEKNRTKQRKELLYSCDFGTLGAERSLILEVHFVLKNSDNSSFLQPDFAGFVRSTVVADFPGMTAKANGECETVLTAHRPTLVQKILQSWDLLMGIALGKEIIIIFIEDTVHKSLRFNSAANLCCVSCASYPVSRESGEEKPGAPT
jgi:hypothetical protein